MTEEKSYAATWCPVCDKQVSVEGRDTCRLLAHIRKYHPKLAGKCLNNQRDEESRISSNQISSSETSVTPVGSSKKNEPKKVYARVDTWKSHNEKKVCPQCQREAVPTLHTRGDKLTTSHIGALCLFGVICDRCWPFCFIPLMMKRAKKIRMICPLCGHVYGTFKYKNAELTPCEPADARNLRAGLASSAKERSYKSQRTECGRNQSSENGAMFPWIPALKASDITREPQQSKNIFSTKVETLKYHKKSIHCPTCDVKTVPIILTKQEKFTSSRLAAFCLLGCWPLCFIPLMMTKDKSVRMICSHCGRDYGTYPRDKGCSPKCTPSRGKFSGFVMPSYYLRTKYSSMQTQPEYRDDQARRAVERTFSTADEAAKALRLLKRPRRRREGGSRGWSQSELSRGYVFCANQVTDHASQHQEGCNSDDCASQRRNTRSHKVHQRDFQEPKSAEALKAGESRTNGSESERRTAEFDFYAKQICCREYG